MRWILVLFALSLTACSSFLNQYAQKPKVDLARVEVSDVGLRAATLQFVVKVENPNRIPLTLDEVNYKILLDGKEFAASKMADGVRIPAEGSAEVVLPLAFEYNRLWTNVLSLFSTRSIQYRIEGDARLTAFKIPFSDEGKFDLKLE